MTVFASYVLFQQARLSHNGGGKSSSNEVESHLSYPYFLGFRAWYEFSPPRSRTTIFFFSLLFRQHIPVCCFFGGGLPGFIAWMSFMFPGENILCMVESGQRGSECSPHPPFLVLCTNVHL